MWICIHFLWWDSTLKVGEKMDPYFIRQLWVKQKKISSSIQSRLVFTTASSFVSVCDFVYKGIVTQGFNDLLFSRYKIIFSHFKKD